MNILDDTHLDVNNANEFKKACIFGRDLGFDGKTITHPNQLKIANKIFSPDDDEIKYAKKVIDAWTRAKAENNIDIVVVDKKIVEHIHFYEAQRILAFTQI